MPRKKKTKVGRPATGQQPVVSFRLPRDLQPKLDGYMRKRKVTKYSHGVRSALYRYFELGLR
jgi:hypothetical protein